MFYALAPGFAPTARDPPSCSSPAACLDLADPSGRTLAARKHFAVIVAGAPLARDGSVQSRAAGNVAEVRQWLEETNALLEGRASCPGAAPRFTCEGVGTCNRVTVAAASRGFNDAVIAFP